MSSTKTILKALAPFIISAGVILTGIASAMGTSKAKTQIEEDKKEAENKGVPYSAKETVKSAARYYLPSVILGAATIAIVFVSDGKHRKAEMTLAGSATAIGAAFNRYKSKLQELYGNEAHENIIREIQKEPLDDTYIHTESMFGSTTLNFGNEEQSEKKHTFYDPFSQRYFDTTFSQILQAEYHLNRNFVLGDFITLNTFYEFLGLAPTDDGDTLGWYLDDDIYWIDFDHIKSIAEDGTSVYVITPVFSPMEDTEFDM